MRYKYPNVPPKTAFSLVLWVLVLLIQFPALAQNEVVVDQFTGTANAFIPLTAVGIKDAGIGINLVYSGKGVKVNDQSNARAIPWPGGTFSLKSLPSDGSFVGTNWSLSGLPSIQREVRGLPDDIVVSNATEKRYGWLSPLGQQRRNAIVTTPTPAVYSPAGSNSQEQPAFNLIQQFEQLYPSNMEIYDSEPDIFSYSFAGHSGQFVFDAQGDAHTIPYDPIEISITNAPPLGIALIQLRTPEGVTYTFDVRDRTSKKTTATQGQNLQYKIRDYNAFNVSTLSALTYTTAWHASAIRNLIGEEITLAYDQVDNTAYDEAFSPQSAWLIVNGNSYATTANQFGWTFSQTQYRVRSITSPTTTVDFETATQDYLYLASITTRSAIFGNLLKKTTFQYGINESKQGHDRAGCMPAPWPWLNANTGVDDVLSSPKRFLLSFETRGECSTPLTYRFGYAGLDAAVATRILPPAKSNVQDYWGNFIDSYDVDGPMVPALTLFPGLSAATTPNAPFRLYNGSLTPKINMSYGSKRQAANLKDPSDNCSVGFNESTLLGTLTSITVPTGGVINLEYEAHQYYDVVAGNDACIGPGPRIKAVTYHDNLTGVEQRREYRYAATTGVTSGRLLRAPRFAFLVPAATATPTNSTQPWSDAAWLEATRRSPDNLASEPFEGRDVGYGRVTEVMPGRGETTTEFDIPATADEVTVNPAAPVPQGIAWQWHRTLVGVARNANAPNASPVALYGPYVPNYDGYPFPLNPPLNFRTGRPLRVQVKAEAVGTSAPALVKQTDYTYRLSSAAAASATSLTTITGLAYEIMPGFRTGTNTSAVTGSVYAYARYELPVDFIYAPCTETVKLYDQVSATGQPTTTFVTTSKQYGYNVQGRLASVTSTNSDGRQYRTRYKYAADYGLPAAGAARTPALAPLLDRVQVDRVTGEVIETIEEVQAPGQGWTVTGAALNTFVFGTVTNSSGTTTTSTTVTRPQSIRRFLSNPGVPATSFEEMRLQTTGTPAVWDVYIGSGYRVESTVEEVDGHLQPLTVTARTGRKITGQHFSYGGRLPVLAIANAYASEVVFSDFESSDARDQGHAFQPFPSGQSTQVIDASQAHTGRGYLSLSASNTGLTTPLPVPSSGVIASPPSMHYLLSFWVRAAATSLTIELTSAAGPVTSTSRAIGSTANWELVEIPFDLTGIALQNRANYAVRIKSTTSVAIALDDVLLLPSTAMAQSSTYDPSTTQKSSTTDARHATTYYDYNPIGQLAFVRDHNKHIVQQVKQTLQGTPVDVTTADFEYTVPACSDCSTNNTIGGVNIAFNALGLCAVNSPRLEWNFGDASTPVTTSALTTNHAFPETTGSGSVAYTVTLTVRTLSGSTTVSKVINVYPTPLRFTACTDGITIKDLCEVPGEDLRNDCFPLNQGTWTTTFIVQASSGVIPAGATYRWYAGNLALSGSSLPLTATVLKWPASTADVNQGMSTTNAPYTYKPTIGYQYSCVINAPNTRPLTLTFELFGRYSTPNCQ